MEDGPGDNIYITKNYMSVVVHMGNCPLDNND